MTVEFRNRGTTIEEEDFCHWTEKDVEFKCLEGLNAKLKKFYSWNKGLSPSLTPLAEEPTMLTGPLPAIIVKIEIEGTVFCGCLYEDNNSFAPVEFGPPKRPPLPCILPSKPKPPESKKDTKTTSTNAYSKENWPRVYIDLHNTVEQRLRFGRDKNLSNNQSNTASRIGEKNSHPRANKVGVLVYNKRKKSSRYEQKSTSSAENNYRLRRSGRLPNSFGELQQINVANGSGSKTESNNKSSGFGHATSKGSKNVVKSVGCKGKKCDALGKTSLLPKPNLRPRGAYLRKYGSEPESINSDSVSHETLSTSPYLLIDLTVSSPECDETQHQTDIIDKSIEMNDTSSHQISHHHSIINPENKEGNKITIVDFDGLSPTLKVDKTTNNAKEEVNYLPKSRSKQKRRKAFAKECLDLSDKFEKMTIRAAALLGQPLMQSSPKSELDYQGVEEEEHFKVFGTKVQDPNSAIADSKPTKISSFF